VEITAEAGAPILTRAVGGGGEENRIKGCLEDGSGKKASENERESKEIDSWQVKVPKLW
jgi:hypothetical protein